MSDQDLVARIAKIIATATYCETVNHPERIAARIVARMQATGRRAA